VVESEVRNLASRSAGAAKEIKALIQDSVGKVNNAVTAMDAMKQEDAALVEEVAAAVQALNEQATSLMKLLGHYRLS
jgi:methyl-accepting chemotaxis protein